MHIFEVNGVKVVFYSTHHCDRAGLKAWVAIPENLAKIQLMLKVPAPPSDDVDGNNPSGDVPHVETHFAPTDSVDPDNVFPAGDASSGLGGRLAHDPGLTNYSGDVSNDPTISKESSVACSSVGGQT